MPRALVAVKGQARWRGPRLGRPENIALRASRGKGMAFRELPWAVATLPRVTSHNAVCGQRRAVVQELLDSAPI